MKVGEMISFIIPTYNSAKTIEKCLDSISKQKCSKEIIVVDGGSSDGTTKIAEKFNTRLITDSGGKISTARNIGLRSAKGRYIAFIDSDVSLPGKWVKNALELIEKDDTLAGVGGPGVSPEKSLVSNSINELLYGKTPGEERFVKSLATMNVMYRKSAIAGQFFNETLETGEDPEFNFRLLKRGYRLLFSSKLKVWHDHPMTLGGLVKKWYNYGTNYPSMCSKHSEMRGGEYYARLSFVPLVIIFSVLSFFNLNFLSVPLLMAALLYLGYLFTGIKIGAGNVLAFSAVHTVKQLAQLAGNFRGIGKLM
jgi:glycosyltransferase involved in cell wall biosynthesis